MSDHVLVNVSGHRFCISRRSLRKFPHTRLSQLFLRETGGTRSEASKLVDSNKLKTGHEYFFDRSPAIFAGIMDLYRSGSIHIPPGACWQLVMDELEFWQVDPARICKSCQLNLADQVNRQKELNELQHAFGDDARRLNDTVLGFSSDYSPEEVQEMNKEALSVKHQFKAFFREPSSATTLTRWTQAYKLIFTTAVVVYVFTYILESEYSFRVSAKSCKGELDTFLINSTPNENATSSTRLTTQTPKTTATVMKFNASSAPYKRFIKYFTTSPSPAILAIDIVCLFLFICDFWFRFALAPAPRISYLRLPETIADVVITAANIVATLLIWVPNENFNCDKQLLLTYLTLEIFRVARLTRLLQFTSRYNGIRVLLLSLGSSLRELLLLLSGLITAVIVFGLTIYVSEIAQPDSNFNSFIIGFWWALVSMTTIGYGDYSPKSDGGMFVGAICAVCGVLYVALQMPVIANRFNALYIYAREQERRLKTAQTPNEAKDETQQFGQNRY